MADFIFQHGGMVGGYIWDELIEAVETRGSDHRFLKLDVPGCGTKRGLDPHDFSFEAMIDGLLADIDACGFNDALLVGHSQGGTVLPRLAEARPKLFEKLIYIACIAPDPGSSIVAAARAEEDPDAPPMTIMDRLINLYCNDMDVPTTKAFLAKLGGGDVWPPEAQEATDWRYDHLEAIASTYILCDRDAILPPERQQASINNLHIDKVLNIDSGHQPMISRPEELADMLLAEVS
ncbi:MAG: alpha/beta hydrolase [Novosphingobium sp.]|nr:alpha/beta hydrolase [Novosphingobium sp.]